MPSDIMYATTSHPDKNMGRPSLRHMVDHHDQTRTLCGRRYVWLYDYATPLLTTCKQCEVQARTRDAAVRIW